MATDFAYLGWVALGFQAWGLHYLFPRHSLKCRHEESFYSSFRQTWKGLTRTGGTEVGYMLLRELSRSYNLDHKIAAGPRH